MHFKKLLRLFGIDKPIPWTSPKYLLQEEVYITRVHFEGDLSFYLTEGQFDFAKLVKIPKAIYHQPDGDKRQLWFLAHWGVPQNSFGFKSLGKHSFEIKTYAMSPTPIWQELSHRTGLTVNTIYRVEGKPVHWRGEIVRGKRVDRWEPTSIDENLLPG